MKPRRPIIVEPWRGILPKREQDLEGMERGIAQFLAAAGYDAADEDHLKRTAARVAEAWNQDVLEGASRDPFDALGTPFEDNSPEMVMVKGVEFFSSCPHHLMPYSGVAHVAYVPAGKTVGFSGIVRLLDCLAHRLTLQEWLTRGVTAVLDEALDPQGSACLIEAAPMCVIAQGVRRPCSVVSTSFTGVFRKDTSLRQAIFDAASVSPR